MGKNYVLKTDPLEVKRIKKYMKDMIDQGKLIEKKAEKTYDYFKKIVDSEPGTDTDTAKKCMIDALKIQIEARKYWTKVFDLCFKLFMHESPKKKGDGVSMEDLLLE